MMNQDLESVLWVIQFKGDAGGPAIRYYEPGLPGQMSETMAVQFLEQMQLFFQQVIDLSREKSDEPEMNMKLDDLTQNLELLQEWMKSFQKFLKNPDDLTGKEPQE